MREGWKNKRLGEIAYYPNLRVSVSDLSAEDYVGVENLIKDRGGVSFGTSKPNIESAIAFSNDDILIGNIRPYLRKIWLANKEGGASGDIVLIRIRNEWAEYISPAYLFKVLSSERFFEYDNANTKGAKMPRGDRKSILDFVVPVPPLPEQERIVAELDLLTGIIDKQKAQLKELDSLAQSIFYDMFGNPLENDKGWNSFSFKDTIRLKSGDGLSEKDFQCGAYPVYGGNGVSGYHNNYNKDGDFIIIGRVGAYCGNVRYVKGQFWLTDNAFQAYFAKESFNYHFMCFLLNTINLHQYANQAAQPVISNVALKDISIICPSLDLQESFAEKIESIESQKAAINRFIAETQKLFDYTMDKYFG